MYLSPEKRAALKAANYVRTSLGFKPVKRLASGYRHMPESCPIARTINEGLRVSVSGIIEVEGYANGKWVKKVFPAGDGACAFIKNFDSGEKHQELQIP